MLRVELKQARGNLHLFVLLPLPLLPPPPHIIVCCTIVLLLLVHPILRLLDAAGSMATPAR